MTTNKNLLDCLTKASQSETPINVLPTLRANINDITPLMNIATEWDLPHIAFTQGYLGLYGFGYVLNDKGQLELDLDCTEEPDYVSFIYEVPESLGEMPTAAQILKLLAIILLFDCSNCCDALEYINISNMGIQAQGNITNTYHS